MFLDTSGLFAYFSEYEQAHKEADSLILAAAELLTHNYVLAELVPLFQTRRVDRRKSLEFQTLLPNSKNIEIVWVDEALHKLAVNLLTERLDKTYSLCDAVSFVLMRTRGITEALTTDRHFEQEGFVRLLKP